jgi:translation initiation factor 1
MADDRRVVYSTGIGRVRYCDRCGAPEAECCCRAHPATGSSGTSGAGRDDAVRISRDRKGRGGKTVTLISGVQGDAAALAALAQTLKRHVASGGAVKDGAIELQGDHRAAVTAKLIALGYKAKQVGG